MPQTLTIGILALQGAVEPHEKHLKRLGVSSVRIRKIEDLEGLSGVILPGGESTTMLHLLKLYQMWEPLRKKLEEIPSWGVCAGAILLAKKVHDPAQDSLALIDVEAHRNSYGTQLDSFVDSIELDAPLKGKIEGIFIRAPRLNPLSDSVRVLGKQGRDAVIVEQGNVLLSSFHPELTDDLTLLEYFLSKCAVSKGIKESLHA